MRWLLENIYGLSEQPNLCLSSINTWVLHKLCAKAGHCLTDSTNASRTLLMDINKLEWSDKMLKEFYIKAEWLPKIVKKSSDNFGKVGAEAVPMLKGTVIGGMLGD